MKKKLKKARDKDKKDYKNKKSLAKVQSERIGNYSDVIREVIEKYAEEIGDVVLRYNKTRTGKTMALRLVRTSTQNVQNRKTHQEMVEGLAVEAAKRLGLNVETVRIMARNHDIGHTFFGHGGEWWLTDIEQEYEIGCTVHNAVRTKRAYI